MEIPKWNNDSSEREQVQKHYSEHKFQENFDNKFGNAIPNIIIINTDIEFGTSIPNYSSTKIRIKVDKSIQIPSCADRKYEFPIKTNLAEQTSGHDCVSEYVYNSLSDFADIIFQYFEHPWCFPSS